MIVDLVALLGLPPVVKCQWCGAENRTGFDVADPATVSREPGDFEVELECRRCAVPFRVACRTQVDVGVTSDWSDPRVKLARERFLRSG